MLSISNLNFKKIEVKNVYLQPFVLRRKRQIDLLCRKQIKTFFYLKILY